MLSAISNMFGKKDKSPEELSNNSISVRSPDEVESLEKIITKGPVTYIFVHADWCGHCQTYKPLWNELTNIPGRTANMGMIHHDMVEKSRILKKAKIPGYPTVLKVFPNSHIEIYKGQNNEDTNAIPNMRDLKIMKKEILSTPTSRFFNLLDMNNKRKASLHNTGIPVSNTRNGALLNTAKVVTNTRNGALLNTAKVVTNTRNGALQNTAKVVTNTRNGALPNSADIVPRRRKITMKNKNNKNNTNLTIFPVSQNTKRNISDGLPSSNIEMKGGSLYTVLSQALKQMGPATLIAANKGLAFPPKKSYGATTRLTRKSKSYKN